MRTIKGPGVFLAQFSRDEAPFNSIKGLAGWAAGKGFKGVQRGRRMTADNGASSTAEDRTHSGCKNYCLCMQHSI